MTLLGLDFDNTLVRYDNLFHQLALKQGLIDSAIPADKTSIRDYLRSKGNDEAFTRLQGEVYGLHILEAEPAEGMLEALSKIQEKGIKIVIISHKTQFPYSGPKVDLRKAALNWLYKYDFFSRDGLNLNYEEVYFEPSKKEKISKILSLRCTHYIDDLPEIANSLSELHQTFLYCPNASSEEKHDVNYVMLRTWNELNTKFEPK